jgi:pyruvate/2-oxoglutarate dehydrogenase complex dihydrolipoamide dehydrogenase (E3) component
MTICGFERSGNHLASKSGGVGLAETPKYDMVIIGSGPGGYVAAIRAGQLGLKTLIVEKDDKFGGACLHVGCIPTKDLLLNAEVYDYFKNAKEYGIVCKEFSIDWAVVQARKAKVVTKLVKGIEFLFKKNKLEMLPRAVPLEDEEISAELEKSFRRQGIAIETQAKVEKATKTASGVAVSYTGADGKSQAVEAETLLVAVGRSPNTQGVGLEKTRVKLERGFVKVDQYMQTDEPGVYAVGDIVANSPLLAHVGSMEGIVAVTHAAGKPAEPINYTQVPNCTYCEPEISSVGLTERQAREAGHKVRVGKFPFAGNSKAGILGAREGFVKMVCDEKYGELLGVHMIGPRVTELVAEATVAMRLEGTALDLSHAIHPHPTLSEAMMEAAHAAHDWAIHA